MTKRKQKTSLEKEVESFVKLENLKKMVPHSYDVIGHVAIIEIPEGMEKYRFSIAKIVLQMNPHIKTVLEKGSERKGIYRIRRYRFLVGKRETETVHKEYGCIFKLDPTKVYFSPRELTERQRIAARVKPNEVVLVMFAGIGPYPIIIAKRQPKVKKIVAIEINPTAVKYMKENIRVNKLSDKIIPVEGDVREKCKAWYGKCDRVVMPLPLGAENFLDIAIRCLKKKGGVIHFYNWGEESKLFDNALKIVRRSVRNMKKKYRILGKRKVLPYKPRTYKICIDFKVYQPKN